MIIKSIIFVLIAYLIQLGATNWYTVLFFSAIMGIGSKSYKQSFYLGCLIGALPYGTQFLFYYSNGLILLNRVSNMLGLNHPFMLISISIVFITLLSMAVSMSFYHAKRIIKNER